MRQREISHTRYPKSREVIGYVDQLVGGKRMYVECTDGKRRLCRVPGKYKRGLWIRESDYVIVEPWEIQGDERGDIIWKYRHYQVDHLKDRGMLKGI
ncbi:MAG: translation initiation factor eIF-1A [Candidatus Diapherotrites archaeon]|nr:translation initiation factor eIF-1A [Candidatus Diapherotrites archaeon]